MSKSKSELSFTDRLIIQLIRFRTRDANHPSFFGDNKNIATCLDIQPDTARKAVTKLIKLGYLQKFLDKQGRRHLAYTGKEYVPIIENLSNLDKRVLKSQLEYYIKECRDAQKELDSAKYTIKSLEERARNLEKKWIDADLRVGWLEAIFTTRGVTPEQVDLLVKEMEEKARAS